MEDCRGRECEGGGEDFYHVSCPGQLHYTLLEKSKQFLKTFCFMIFILVWILLFSLENFREFHLQGILSNVKTFIQCRDFYALQRILSIVETFIQCRAFNEAQRPLSSVETFIQCRVFHPVCRLSSSVESLIQCRDFYLV